MKAPVKIELNGTLLTGRIDGLDAFQTTVRENNDQGAVETSYSSELTFYDDGYLILKAQLIDDLNAFANEVQVKIYDECCNRIVFTGIITATSIDWCEPICSITTNIIEKNEDLNCIQSVVIWDDRNDFLQQNRKKLRYCVDLRPEFLYYIIVLIYALLNTFIISINLPLSLALASIAFLLYGICTIVCLIPGTDCSQSDCNDSEWINPENVWLNLTGWLDDIQERLILCGWYHPTAFVRDYIKNACDICGIEFQSSILNDAASPYYNTLLFSAQVRKGYKPSFADSRLIGQNLPVETVETLMQGHLNKLFNAKYWIKNGRLIFERKDYFDQNDVWIDTAQLLSEGRIINDEVCFSYIDKERPAFAVYQYSNDAADLTGNEAKQRFDNITEWNDPPSLTQKGKLEMAFPSSQGRFRGDEISKDVFTQLADIELIDLLFGNNFSQNLNTLLMAQHVAMNYKFLIWDDESGDDYALVKRKYSDSFVGGGGFYDYKIEEDTGNLVPFYVGEDSRFNYPFTFYEGQFSPAQNNLYYDFHIIDNPRNGTTKNYNFSFTFSFECSELSSFDFSKTVKLYKSNILVYGTVTELTINYLNRTIAVSGIV
jgi:hypothetical protein